MFRRQHVVAGGIHAPLLTSKTVYRAPYTIRRKKLRATYGATVPIAYTDAATVLLDLQASGADVKQTTDAATVFVDLQTLGGECFTSWSGEFLGEGEAWVAIYSSSEVQNWSSDEEPDFTPGDVETEGAHC